MRTIIKPLALWLALALLPAVHGAQAAPATGLAPRAAHQLRVTPITVALGGCITVQLGGLHPGEPVAFVERPLHLAGFGGGLMGTWMANARGVIRFTYPVGDQQWEVGAWQVLAEGNPRVHAGARFSIARR